MKNTKISQNPVDHLKATDPILGSVIERVTLKPLKPNRNYFEALVVEIINQQLSGRVADVMEARFRALFIPHEKGSRAKTRGPFWESGSLAGFPEPQAVLAVSDSKLRTTGISFSKISYIKNVARAAEEGMLNPVRLRKLSDEEIIAELTKIKGIGRWTAEMFLMFTMARPDVFSYGDLGLRKAMIRLYNLRKHPTPKRAEQISNPWRPFRTLASRYLWASVDGA